LYALAIETTWVRELPTFIRDLSFFNPILLPIIAHALPALFSHPHNVISTVIDSNSPWMIRRERFVDEFELTDKSKISVEHGY
jgi:hypothetical protein